MEISVFVSLIWPEATQFIEAVLLYAQKVEWGVEVTVEIPDR